MPKKLHSQDPSTVTLFAEEGVSPFITTFPEGSDDRERARHRLGLAVGGLLVTAAALFGPDARTLNASEAAISNFVQEAAVGSAIVGEVALAALLLARRREEESLTATV